MVKKCFFCGSPNVIRNGLRGRKKQYKSKDCARQFLGGTRRDKSQVILEYIEDKQTRKQLAAKVCELQEKNTELQKAATSYYLYTADIPPKVNAFSANGTTAVFIPTTEAFTGILRLPTFQLIHFQQKSVEHILNIRFRYGMCMCIGVKMVANKMISFIIMEQYKLRNFALFH